jgi:hypothetical protein
MFRLTPVLAGGLVTGLAAVVAAVLTVATTTPTASELSAVLKVNRITKADQLQTDSVRAKRLQAILFNSNSVAFEPEMNKPSIPGIAREVVIEQTQTEKSESPRSAPMKNGCDSGLSPDISPTVPLSPGRCVVQREIYTTVASINQ